MKLKALFSNVQTISWEGSKEKDINGIAYSSKSVKEGFLFAALKGQKLDGHSFTGEALKKGAVAILSEKPKPENFSRIWIQVSDARAALALCSANFFEHPSEKMKVVGITGTKGKTTLTYLLEEILKKASLKIGVIGTVSYRGPNLTVRAERTTPEAPELQALLKTMLDKGVSHCLMEVSSHSLELKRVMGVNFYIGVFTNLTGEHMDFHSTMEKYFEAKRKLFTLGTPLPIAVINADDSWGEKLASQLPGEKITYGLDSSASIWAFEHESGEKGISLGIRYPEGKMDISSHLLGKPNIYNILAAVSTSLALKIPVFAIQSGVASLQKVPGRFESIPNSLGIHIIVDYAHTDDALKNLLETVKEFGRGQTLLVFGAGGDRDRTKRPRMGEVAGKLADRIIITSDNPRSEEPLAIISDIEKGVQKTGRTDYTIEPDRRKAIQMALGEARRGDSVLVAGKGHESHQIIGSQVLPFHDGKVVREILESMEKNR